MFTNNDAHKQNEARRTQLYKGVTELALMHLLKNEAQYGLKILDNLRSEAGLDLSEGTLYPLLHRMEKSGLIVAEWRMESDASHPRKYYSLTQFGTQDLQNQRKDWLNMTSKLNHFLHSGDA